MKSAKMKQILLCMSMTFVLLPRCVLAATKADYYRLYEYLFEDSTFYKKQIRPAKNENDTTIVEMLFDLISVVDVDEKEQTLVSSALVTMHWSDSLLAWDVGDYDGISEILVPQNNIYLPDLIVANSARQAKQLGYPELQVRVTAGGYITWEISLLVVTSCDIDITFFPFDTQKCFIVFETAVSRNNEIFLKMVDSINPISLEFYSPNGQWELVGTSAEDLNEKGYKASVQFGILLKRRRTFYILTIILPIFFLSLTASLVFALPADEGEKMGTGITVLLAFAVYLTIVSDLVPNTSLQVSILSVYLTTLLGMSAVSIIVCVFILRLHFRDEDVSVGPQTTSFILFLRRIMCQKKNRDISLNKVMPQQREVTDISLQDKTKTRANGTKNHTMSVEEVFLDDIKLPLTWKDVAKTLDRFCFILFTSLTIVFTLACLLTLLSGGEINVPGLEDNIKGNTTDYYDF